MPNHTRCDKIMCVLTTMWQHNCQCNLQQNYITWICFTLCNLWGRGGERKATTQILVLRKVFGVLTWSDFCWRQHVFSALIFGSGGIIPWNRPTGGGFFEKTFGENVVINGSMKIGSSSTIIILLTLLCLSKNLWQSTARPRPSAPQNI